MDELEIACIDLEKFSIMSAAEPDDDGTLRV